MTDVFYFTKSTVGLLDLEAFARKGACDTALIDTCDGPHLKITGQNDEAVYCIPIEPMGRDYLTFEADQQKVISSLQPTSGFIISYYPKSHAFLVALLKQVLQRYGGWVGAENIDTL